MQIFFLVWYLHRVIKASNGFAWTEETPQIKCNMRYKINLFHSNKFLMWFLSNCTIFIGLDAIVILILWFGKTTIFPNANGSEAIPVMSQERSAAGSSREKRSQQDPYSNKLHSWPVHTSHVVTSWRRISPPLQMLSHFWLTSLWLITSGGCAKLDKPRMAYICLEIFLFKNSHKAFESLTLHHPPLPPRLLLTAVHT